MPANYVLLEKITVGAAGASSVTFSNIPQTGYTDLIIKCSVRNASTVDWTGVYFNGVTTGYSNKAIQSTGSAVSTRSTTDKDLSVITDPSTFTANTFSNVDIYIPNYTSSNFKSYSIDGASENNATLAYIDFSAHLWSNTAAINSVTLNTQSNLFAQHSTFYLYGVAKLATTPLISPKASGGNTIMTDGTYWYHAFLSSGTFTPSLALSCDVLVVAGGGGSGRTGGGGGAGGLRGFTSQSISTAQTVTIGGGGTGATVDGTAGTNGSASSIGSLTASGGGGGASYYPGAIGQNGGSGGGGGTSDGTALNYVGGSGNSGSYSPVEGFAGGTGTATRGGGGGGGATAVGANAPSTNNGGNGGAGSSAYSSWGIVTETGQLSGGVRYFAGGGGGTGRNPGVVGTGGLGGGGTGNNAGTANTGGGAGANNDNNGMAGGSGIVIVRYAV